MNGDVPRKDDAVVPGQRYSFFLAHVCRAARQAAKESQETIANLTGLKRSSVNRFEMNSTWPRNPESMLRAYAEVVGKDSRELWEIALSQWREHGLEAELPRQMRDPKEVAEDFERAVDDLVQAGLQESAGREAEGRAPRRTRAA